jgi:electron transfer flavoprotein beta subunit
MKFKYSLATSELATADDARKAFIEERPYLHIVEFAAADVNPDYEQLGLSGSPTKVKKIENVVFQAKEAKALTADDADIEALMVELIAGHTLG